jgi:hypothetical protein
VLIAQRRGDGDHRGRRADHDRHRQRRAERDADRQSHGRAADDSVHDRDRDRRREVELPRRWRHTHVRHHACCVVVAGEHEIAGGVAGTLEVVMANAIDRSGEQEVLDPELDEPDEGEYAEHEERRQRDEREDPEHRTVAGHLRGQAEADEGARHTAEEQGRT